MVEYLKSWLLARGLAESAAGPSAIAILILGLVAVAVISNYATRRILLAVVHMFVRKSRTSWDDALASRRVFARLSQIAPAMVIYAAAGVIPQFESFLQQISLVYMMLVGLSVWSAVQSWVEYEDISADIMDHILAIMPEFELRVFQNPTGYDFRNLNRG